MKERLIYRLLLLLLLAGAGSAYGQGRFSLNNIPLNKELNVRLLGCDEELLHCYNLYGFAYVTPDDSMTGEFIVLKEKDDFKDKDFAIIKLCRVREFSILAGKKCRSMKVENGIQLKYPDRMDKVYLNFDPDGPEPVFIHCK